MEPLIVHHSSGKVTHDVQTVAVRRAHARRIVARTRAKTLAKIRAKILGRPAAMLAPTPMARIQIARRLPIVAKASTPTVAARYRAGNPA